MIIWTNCLNGIFAKQRLHFSETRRIRPDCNFQVATTSAFPFAQTLHSTQSRCWACWPGSCCLPAWKPWNDAALEIFYVREECSKPDQRGGSTCMAAGTWSCCHASGWPEASCTFLLAPPRTEWSGLREPWPCAWRPCRGSTAWWQSSRWGPCTRGTCCVFQTESRTWWTKCGEKRPKSKELTPQPDSEVLDLQGLLFSDFLHRHNLSSGLLELSQLSKEVPEPGK